MNNKDPNYIVKLERAISQKYGEETILNPRDNWDDNKEEEYFKQLKELEKKEEEQIEKEIKKDNNRTCLKCNEYSFKKIDDIYMLKYQCCYRCYLRYLDHPNFNKK